MVPYLWAAMQLDKVGLVPNDGRIWSQLPVAGCVYGRVVAFIVYATVLAV